MSKSQNDIGSEEVEIVEKHSLGNGIFIALILNNVENA